MAIAKFATQKLIAPGSNDPAIIPIGVILHVDAGNAESLFPYFNGPSEGVESHFHIKKDGEIEQYRNTGFEADANLKANSFIKDGKRYGFISIETQGYEEGEWTPAQIESIKRLIAWASRTHGFPLRKCPGPFAPGVGYHTLFGAPSEWTPVAKSCPGPDRKVQFEEVLVPWFKRASEPKPQAPVPPAAPKPPVVPVPAPEPSPTRLELVAEVERLTRRVKALRTALRAIHEITSEKVS